MGGVCWFLKRPQEGIRYLEKGIAYYERTDHKATAADGYNNLASTDLDRAMAKRRRHCSAR